MDKQEVLQLKQNKLLMIHATESPGQKRSALVRRELPTVFPLMPLLRYLRFLGGLPFAEDSSGLRFSVLSWPMLYCISITAFQWFLAQYSILNSRFYRGFSLGFNSFVRSLVGVMYLAFMCLCLITWINTPAIVRAVNKWKKLQIRLEFIVRKSPSSVLLDYPVCCLLVIIVVSIMELTLSFVGTGQLRPLVFVVFALIAQNLVVCTWLWVVFPHLVSVIAAMLKNSVIRTVLSNGPAQEVRSHRELWEELRQFTMELTTAIADSVKYWLLLRLLLFVFSLYAAAVYIQSTGRVPIYTLNPLLRSILDLVIVCECAHRTDHQMRREFNLAVLSCNLQRLSDDVKEEIKLLLCSVERAGNIFSLQGTFELNRGALLKILSWTATYIIVLIQLKDHPLFRRD